MNNRTQQRFDRSVREAVDATRLSGIWQVDGRAFTRLPRGAVVLATMRGKYPGAVTYSNDTQAERRAAELRNVGFAAYVSSFLGRVRYVALHCPEVTP